jgi:hypothetical protein
LKTLTLAEWTNDRAASGTSWYATSSLAMLITRTEPAGKAYQSPRVISVWPSAAGTEK